MSGAASVQVPDSEFLRRGVSLGSAALARVVKLLALALLMPLAPSVRADAHASRAASSLAQEKAFALGGVGVAGTMSPGESDLRAVLKEADALQQLQSLLKEASPAGQLYALLGLRLRDRPAYEQAVPAFRKRSDVVSTIHGCIVMDEKMDNIVHQIERGDHDTFLTREFR
jgi:hypothetical protein